VRYESDRIDRNAADALLSPDQRGATPEYLTSNPLLSIGMAYRMSSILAEMTTTLS